MSRRATRPIYGVSSRSSGGCPTGDNCLTSDLLVDLYALAENMETLIGQLFPEAKTQSNVITKIKSVAFMNDYTYVRFVWISRHPDVQFTPYKMNSNGSIYKDPSSGLRVLSWAGVELRNIYREFNLESSVDKDPLFKNVLF